MRIISDDRTATIDSNTIKQSLPGLWKHRMSYMPDPHCLDLDAICAHKGRTHPKAVRILGQYLREIIGQSQVSAALSKGLDETLRSSRSPHHDSAVIFQSLATMFDRKYFGCNSKIFRDMESFFQRRCIEIFDGPPEYWKVYINGLDRMSLSLENTAAMTSVLAAVIQHEHPGRHGLRQLSQLYSLSSRSQRVLKTLISQEEAQRTKHQYRHDLRLTCSHMRPPLCFGEPDHRLPMRGDQMDPTVVIDIAMHEPHRVIIDDHCSVCDDSLFDEDDYSDDDACFANDQSLIDYRSLAEFSCQNNFDHHLLGSHLPTRHLPMSDGHPFPRAMLALSP